MFLDLFYGLRDEGVPVAIQEWRMLVTVLEKGLHDSSLFSFYNLAKATLIKTMGKIAKKQQQRWSR